DAVETARFAAERYVDDPAVKFHDFFEHPKPKRVFGFPRSIAILAVVFVERRMRTFVNLSADQGIAELELAHRLAIQDQRFLELARVRAEAKLAPVGR